MVGLLNKIYPVYCGPSPEAWRLWVRGGITPREEGRQDMYTYEEKECKTVQFLNDYEMVRGQGDETKRSGTQLLMTKRCYYQKTSTVGGRWHSQDSEGVTSKDSITYQKNIVSTFIELKPATYSVRTEKVLLAVPIWEVSQLGLDSPSLQNFLLVRCPRSVVWLVRYSKWAWLRRKSIWSPMRRFSNKFLVKYEMSRPEQTLFLFLPSQENKSLCSHGVCIRLYALFHLNFSNTNWWPVFIWDTHPLKMQYESSLRCMTFHQ